MLHHANEFVDIKWIIFGHISKLVIDFIHIILWPTCSRIHDKISFRRNTILRSTKGAVRGPQYGPLPSIQPEKRSFEGCIEGGPY